ncbi:GIY-YIG nuclease family protein [Flavobacterium muglaense]|uniref:GIY-YIG nuclease family protein n=1 Tax=Flavobacterium muglaense TaxID=2764716 RepID=A0A923SF49_9FLAO|nr:GIY-YIG nuclease family protein [Flavobacterium muglaense]MBC5837563.1 GIY-YIG nuclease family protein [Flavobacterium muglaense]MBC5844090.1 GIY-YIG nuclease family protein [Flavobacterium muglaense]
MSKKKITLDDIFNDDEFGLLESKAKVSNIKSEEERLIDSFQEINAFYQKNNREPKADVFVVSERSLGVVLKELRKNNKKIEILKPYDTYDLLGNVIVEINSIDDILNDDEFGLLDTDDTLEIFKLKNVPSSKDREETDFVARRKPIKEKEFASYETAFKKVHQELREGKRKLNEFKDVEQNLEQGKYYLLDGLLLFLEKDGIEDRQIKDRIRKDGRTKIIFENGTESNMYYRSLAKALYVNGRIVSDTDSEAENELFKNANIANEEDLETGWIYILKSKSTNKSISEIKDLYKIGFSKVDVRDRIKNAAKEPTYLMAEVHIVSTYKCYNVNPHKFEQLLHRFFAEVCLNIDIHDDKGRRITPREWFVVPLPIIDKVIELILSGEIVEYKYDVYKKLIMKREI